MKTIKNITYSAFTLFVFAWLAFTPILKAGCPNPPGVCGGQNTAVGEDALFSVTTGVWNVGVGADALFHTTDGNQSTGIGYQTLFNNTSGDHHVGIGSQALFNNTTGSDNVGVGFRTLYLNTSGSKNTGMGYRTLANNTTGEENTAIGWNALYINQIGFGNTAIGSRVLLSNIGGQNTATGYLALTSNTIGSNNVANGFRALISNTEGISNTAIGPDSLFDNTTGDNNVAVGDAALGSSISGDKNVAIGAFAGSNVTTASNVICIGANVAGENVDNRTYIRNIKDTIVSGGGTDFVSVNLTTGLLGHVSSSRRYKEDIKSMDKTSELLYELKPVTYRFKKEIDPSQSLEYGLVAEEVAQVNPNLAIRDGKGQIESVRYTAINAMLLNEFLKEHRTVQELKSDAAKQEAKIARQQEQIEELTTGLQKVRAEFELSNTAPKTVLNNR